MRKFDAEAGVNKPNQWWVEIYLFEGVPPHLVINAQGGGYFSSKKSAKRAANRIAGQLGYELEWVN